MLILDKTHRAVIDNALQSLRIHQITGKTGCKDFRTGSGYQHPFLRINIDIDQQ